MSRLSFSRMLMAISCCFSIYAFVRLLTQAASQQVTMHVIAMKQMVKRLRPVRTRGFEDMLARQKRHQPPMTALDSPTIVALHPEALAVLLEIATDCLDCTIGLAASQQGCKKCPGSLIACAGCGTQHCSGRTQDAVWDTFRQIKWRLTAGVRRPRARQVPYLSWIEGIRKPYCQRGHSHSFALAFLQPELQ